MTEASKTIKISDKRGQDDGRWDTPAATPAAPAPEPTAAKQADAQAAPPKPEGAHLVYADHGTLRTSFFRWRCPACKTDVQITHLVSPRESEAISSGGSIEGACAKCGAAMRVVMRQVDRATGLPGLPTDMAQRNRGNRRAHASKQK